MGKVIPFVISCQDQDFEASTLDISEKGIGIKISGRPPIVIGDILDLIISDFSMEAKVMWIKRLSNGALAGLQRVH